MNKILVIKGMEMPKECITENEWHGNCPLDRLWCAQRFAPEDMTNGEIYAECEGKIPEWCPLIEVTLEEPVSFKNGKKVEDDI